MVWMAESDLEAWMMDALVAQGFAAAHGSKIAPDAEGSPRTALRVSQIPGRSFR